MSEKNKIVLTGSEGLIGKRLREHLTNQYEVLSLDLELGHDLTNERFGMPYYLKCGILRIEFLLISK